jgi:hypothetical protein
MRAASLLDASPLCSVQQTADCIREIKVTIIDTSSGKSTHATVTMPDGSDNRLRLVQSRGGLDIKLDADTLSQLIPGQEVSAHMWRGKIISLQTAWQRNISTSEDPHTGRLVKLLIGVLGLLIAGFKLWPDVAPLFKK